MAVAVLGTVLNLAVIVSIVIDPLKVLRKGPWITILSLAFADLITCISGFSAWGWKHLVSENIDLDQYFTFVDFFYAFGTSASFLTLTFLTMQIFFITKYPMKSRYWLTTTKVILLGIGVCLFAVLLGLSNIAWLRYHWRKCLKIYIARIAILQVATVVQVILNIRVATMIIRSGRTTGNTQITKHKNIAKTVMILTLILFFTAFPFVLFKQLEFLARLEYIGGRGETAKLLSNISVVYTPIAFLNFTSNPILYSLRLTDYRNTFLVFIGKKKRNLGSSMGTMRNTSTVVTNTFSMKTKRESESSNGNCKQ